MSTKALPEPRHACANCANFYPVRRLRGKNLTRCFTGSVFDPVTGKDQPQFKDAAVIREEYPDTCPRFTPKGPSKASQALTQVRGLMGRVGSKLKKDEAPPSDA